MRIDDIVKELRADTRMVSWRGSVIEALPGVTRRLSDSGQQNLVNAFDLDETSADAAIRAEIDHFGALSQGFEWKAFSFDSPPDLLERLRSAGFEIGDCEAVEIYDLSQGTRPLEGSFACDVHRVDTLDRLADFRAVAEAAFEKDYSLTTNELAEAIRSGLSGHAGYVAYVGGVPAAAGRLYTNPASAFAGLYGGGTRPEFRGRGCYRAIVAARAGDAFACGCRYLMVDALPTSRPILERLGFVRIADTWACEWRN